MSSYELPPTVSSLLEKQLATGQYASEEEVLVAALQSLDELNEDWNAVKESLDTLDQGDRGLSLDDAIAEVKRRNGVDS